MVRKLSLPDDGEDAPRGAGAHEAAMRVIGAPPGHALDFPGILDAAGSGVVVLDPQGTLLYVNAAVGRIVGRDLRGWVGRSIRTVATDAGFAATIADGEGTPLTRAVERHEPTRGVLVREDRADGSQSWYSVDFAPVVHNGTLWYVVLTASDVTERQREAAALRARSEQLRVVLENAPIGACILDERGVFEMVNAEFCALFGCQSPGMVGQSFEDFLPASVRLAFEERLRRPLAPHRTLPDTVEIAHTEGAQRFHIASVAFTGADDRTRLAIFLRDVTAQNITEERLTRLALYDGLTGLPNRLLFSERLTQAINAARLSWRMAAVLFMDFDGFKRVNDTWGHDAGDTVLRILAQRLRACVRESDDVARRGGDEFLVLMPVLAVPEDAAALARKILRACGEAMTVKGRRVQLGVSIGIAIYPFDGADAEAMIVSADRAMYSAKRRGKGTYVFAQRDTPA